MIYSRW